jgi:hypothetical protein
MALLGRGHSVLSALSEQDTSSKEPILLTSSREIRSFDRVRKNGPLWVWRCRMIVIHWLPGDSAQSALARIASKVLRLRYQ